MTSASPGKLEGLDALTPSLEHEALQASKDQELDLPFLRRSLAQLGREVEEAQARVLATVEARHAEFLAASGQVSDLRSAITGLRSDLRQATLLLQDKDPASCRPSDEADSAAVALVHRRVEASAAEHVELKGDLAALDTSVEVLAVVLEVQHRFEELDVLIGAGRFGEAAELTLDIAKALEKISAPAGAAEPGILRTAKAQYYQRRAILSSRLEDALSQLIVLGDGRALARQSALLGGDDSGRGATSPVATVTLPQVWGALRILGLLGRRLEQFTDEAQRCLLRPLLDAARCLVPGRRLVASIDAGTSAWSWSEVQDGAQNVQKEAQSSTKPPVSNVLEALESLFLYAQASWAGGMDEVYAMLGFRLYPWAARCLLRHFDTCGLDGGEALEGFELKLMSKGFITAAEKTLSRHVHEHRNALSEQHRAAALAEARAWLLEVSTAEASLVRVSDATLPGSITQLLEASGAKGGSLQLPQAIDSKLRDALESDDALLRLPEMHVSGTAEKFVRRLWTLMDDLAAAVEESHVEAARDLNKLVRELCTLFSILRPFSQKSQLKTDAQCCAIFLADCLYLVHILILLPYSYHPRLPGEHRQLAFFMDLVPQLRRLGESHFLSMLRHQKEQLLLVLRPCNLSSGAAKDGSFVAAEAALGSASQQLKAACRGLAVALPAQLLRETVMLLLGAFCEELLGKLLGAVEPSAMAAAAPPAPAEALAALTGEKAPAIDLAAGVGRFLGSALAGMQGAASAVGNEVTGESGEQATSCVLSAEDLACIAALLTSAQAMVRQILLAADLLIQSGPRARAEQLLDEVPGWSALAVAADLLGSDFSRFLERRKQLLEALRKEQAIRLIQLSWHDEALSPEEAWGVLSGGGF
eukprot:TRINITY_DN24200_c0_g1_i1.p1 TRINITY_DN24200_c0_g1~~TRINITY_DN24200_c0_g1_i1.p1  ORF type:complete len:875 (-),score=231.35 TRINITY_DN24200_c0_g1_i1:18-2642(-)